MEVIVNDASALLDIYKAGLLSAYSKLNVRLLLPDLVARELKSLDRADLADFGFEIARLDGDGILKVIEIRSLYDALSTADSFALVLAESLPGSILLTGDRRLRTVAVKRGVKAHGVLWLVDQLYNESLLGVDQILSALALMRNDPTVRLPAQLLSDYIEKYGSI